MKWLILLILLLPVALAQPGSINVLNLEYDNGNIQYLEKFNTIGYYPDRLIQEGDYTLKIMGDEVLYETRFSPPRIEYLDGDKGGIFTRNKFNFSLTVPSFADEKEIVIEKNNVEEQFSLEKERTYWPYIVAILAIALILFKVLRK